MNLGGINFSEHGSNLSDRLPSTLHIFPASRSHRRIPHHELPFLVCHLTLQTPDGDDATFVRSPYDEVVAMLYGTLVAAPAEMNDQAGAAGVYFAFPDVSIRYVGRFRLRASLMRITGGPPLDTCITDTLQIVENSEYTKAITALTRHFDAQGVVRFGLPRAEW